LSVLPWFQGMVLVNPLVYASEGFRSALTPQVPHLSLLFIFAGLVGFSALFTYLGLKQFAKRALD
jgi:ABC-2 type transport system permease protein